MKPKHRQPKYLHPGAFLGGLMMADAFMETLNYPPITGRTVYRLARAISLIRWDYLTPRGKIYHKAWARRLMTDILSEQDGQQ